MPIKADLNLKKTYSALDKNGPETQKINALRLLAKGVAHDINNILGAVEGYSSIIMNSATPKEPLLEDISEIRKSIKAASLITRQLTIFGETGMPDAIVSNPNELIAHLSQMLDKYLDKNIKLEMDLEKNPPACSIDSSKMLEALLNIVLNAKDAINNSARQGTIKIKTTTVKIPLKNSSGKKEMVVISISDNGCGIKKEYFDFILDPFFTTKIRGKGRGMGLSAACSIIEQHKGFIEISTQEGKGSVFDIYLPSTKKPIFKEKIKTSPIPSKNKTGEARILLLEDDDSLRTATVRVLKSAKFKVFPCRSCAQAKKVFKENNGDFDIIFSDIILSDGNGIDTAKELAALNRKIKIVITSGYIDETRGIEDIIKGRYKFIPKPYSLENLLKTFNT
ncbi:MAG: ATP-binding protein [Elusimicrobiota bacterium]|nr:ATP-binding protein [Elusimicrobiota bacterium]